jgi:hypothetical protein
LPLAIPQIDYNLPYATDLPAGNLQRIAGFLPTTGLSPKEMSNEKSDWNSEISRY